MQQNIAVIGGGAKAAALAAKAFCLRQVGIPISVTIFEKNAIAAAWDGTYGYTDGLQRLCTPAERDLGFPHDRVFGLEVTRRMLGEFSWTAYQSRTSFGLSDWISRGRKPPTHLEFAGYLRDAVARSEADVFYGEVTGLLAENRSWTVIQTDRDSGDDTAASGFHGVVVTGPGPARAALFGAVDGHDKVFTGQTFWERLADIKKMLPEIAGDIVILGGGGTAAAIAAWFVRMGQNRHTITLLSTQATLFTRTANFFEDRLFDDEGAWQALGRADRRSFTLRLNRGVVWESVTELLTDARNLDFMPGRAQSVERTPDGGLAVVYTNHHGRQSLPAALVVDATGFDPWWFRRLLPDDLQPKLTERLAARMRKDLSFPLPGWPRLHAPMHSQVVGPGFMSLMTLGSMADNILTPYARTASRS